MAPAGRKTHDRRLGRPAWPESVASRRPGFRKSRADRRAPLMKCATQGGRKPLTRSIAARQFPTSHRRQRYPSGIANPHGFSLIRRVKTGSVTAAGRLVELPRGWLPTTMAERRFARTQRVWGNTVSSSAYRQGAAELEAQDSTEGRSMRSALLVYRYWPRCILGPRGQVRRKNRRLRDAQPGVG